MKKVLCTVLALAMALALLAGCGGAPASSGSTAASGSAGNAENATIKVAALVSGYENTYPGMWQEVCDAFTAQTGINVELTLEQNLEDVLNASMQGGDYPDVIHLATGRPAGLTEQFINGKMIADITDVLDMTVPGEDVKVGDKIIEGFTETSATNPYGDGKTYLALFLCSSHISKVKYTWRFRIACINTVQSSAKQFQTLDTLLFTDFSYFICGDNSKNKACSLVKFRGSLCWIRHSIIAVLALPEFSSGSSKRR